MLDAVVEVAVAMKVVLVIKGAGGGTVLVVVFMGMTVVVL